jgi:hypothetical protein
MTIFVPSMLAYFIAYYSIKRYLDGQVMPKSMTRSMLIFVFALSIAYAVALFVDWFGARYFE